jgi:hypothetical protein
MELTTVFEIVELALSVARTQTSGKIHEDTVLADNILQIIKKTVDAGTARPAETANLAPSETNG